MKCPQTPRKGTVNFLQKMMLREESLEASVSELLAKNLKLEAENERLRAQLLHSVGNASGTRVAGPEQTQ